MKFRILSTLFTLYFFSLSAHSALIDTENSSFVDNASSLEWMDFGINNGISYDSVKELTKENQVYDGWRLASEKELLGLWLSVFGETRDGYYNQNHYGTGYGRTDQENDVDGVSSIENVFDVMGFNSFVGGDRYSLGWYEGDDGNLKYFHLYNSISESKNDKAFLNGQYANFNSWRVRGSDFYSTMLVRAYQPVPLIQSIAIEIPEPAGYVIFFMGILMINLFKINRIKESI